MKNNTIIEKTIGIGWVKVLEAIYDKGMDFYDEGRPLRELTGVRIIIASPNYKDKLIWSICDQKTIEVFRNSFLGKEKWLKDVDIIKNFNQKEAISYSVRLFDYEGFDQVNNVIERLSKIPESKRCMIITPMPHKDWKLDYLPCIDTIHFLIRDDRLDVYVHCRGLDFAQKAYANFVCLAELQKYILDQINLRIAKKIKLGKIDLLVDSAHIYTNTMQIASNLIAQAKKIEKVDYV